MRALVVFCNTADHSLSWLLRPGFRHVFCVIESNGLWLEIDGRCGVPSIRYLSQSDFDLATFYRDQGLTVVETAQGANPSPWPLALANCVGLVKVALCIRSWAVTPYQLYKHLERSA